MAYTTETMDRILTSPEARKLVSMVAPIYGDSETALWLFQAIGYALDEILAYVDDLRLQIFPQTATWGLESWERAWEIVPDPSLSIERRRANIMNKWRKWGSMNPARLGHILSLLAGCEVDVEETPGSNLIQVNFLNPLPETRWEAVYRGLYRAKPAHIIVRCSIQMEAKEAVTLHFGGGVGSYARISVPEAGDGLEASTTLHTGGATAIRSTMSGSENTLLPPSFSILRTGGVCTIISNFSNGG